MSVTTAIWVGVITAVVVGILGWLARLVFRRPQASLQRALDGPPVAVEVQTHLDQMSDVPVLEGPTSYTFGKFDPRDHAEHPLRLAAWQNWAYVHGGEDVGTSIVQVTLQGLSDDPISIEAPTLSPHNVVARTTTRHFGPGGLGGGGVMPRHYTFRVTGSDTERTFDEEGGRPEAFQLASGETERLVIKVEILDASRHEWGVLIPYICRGRRDHIQVTPSTSSLFVTVGATGLEYWFYNGGWFKSEFEA